MSSKETTRIRSELNTRQTGRRWAKANEELSLPDPTAEDGRRLLGIEAVKEAEGGNESTLDGDDSQPMLGT